MCARITIIHVCFIALTFPGSLERCLNSQPGGLEFKLLPRVPVNVNACKNIMIPRYYSKLIGEISSWLYGQQYHFYAAYNLILDHIPRGIPNQIKYLNTVIPIFMHFQAFIHQRHQMKATSAEQFQNGSVTQAT